MIKQDKKKKSFRVPRAVRAAGNSCTLALLLAACTLTDESPVNDNYAILSPQIQVGGTSTRSVIGGTNATPGGNEINTVQLFITRSDDGHTVYDTKTNGLATFVLGDAGWKSTPEVGLSSVMARIFAFYPQIEAENLIPSTADAKHKIKVNIPAGQTFDGTKTWDCNTSDYLYGSGKSDVGDATAITANNGGASGGTKPFSPEISMQHALSYLVFTLQSTAGRDVDNTYDYVKEVRLSTTDGTNQFRISGTSDHNTMQINDGTLDLSNSQTLTFTATAGTAQLCGRSANPQMVAYGLVAPFEIAPKDLRLTMVLDKKGETTTEKRELSVTLTPKVWKKGNRYTFNLTLTERSITVESTTIDAWGEGWVDGDGQGGGSLYPDGHEPSTGA